MTNPLPTLQSPDGYTRFEFRSELGGETVTVITRESFPKQPDNFRYAGSHAHFAGNARNMWRSLIRQGWVRIA